MTIMNTQKGDFMRINNIQRSEVITTNRRGIGANGVNRNTVAFQSKAKKAEQAVKTTATAVKPLLPQSVIDHFGLDMTTAVKYKGEPSYKPAPETLEENVKKFFHHLEIDWNTHIDPNKPRKSYS